MMIMLDGCRRIPYIFLPFFLALFSIKADLSFAANTIFPNQSLSGTQTITSQSGIFELGFFKPGNSQNYYIGIWYKKIPEKTVVWVANREKPVPDTSFHLKISEDGNLVLLSQTQVLIWSSNSNSKNPNATLAILQNTGNLVLRHGSDSSSSVIWQSFDHVTDTWLPRGWLGLNKITRENQQLISWKNPEDPAPGPYSLEIDPNGTGQYIIRWNRSTQYWTSGVWDGKIFNLVPEMSSNYIYNFSYKSDANGNNFSYYVYDSSIITRFVMDLSGQIKVLSWLKSSQAWNLFWSQPRAQCDVYSLCGPFGICDQESMPFCRCLKGFEPGSERDWNRSVWSDGCVRRTPLQCESREKDEFWRMPNMRLPVNSQSLQVGSADECELACLNNCSCTAYAYEGQCSIWNGDLLHLQQLSDGDVHVPGGVLYLRLAAASTGGKMGIVTRVVVGGVVGIAIILGLVWVLIWQWRRRWMIRSFKVVQGSLVPFSYGDLQIVTKNFSEKLGGGGFGSVFKGVLPDASAIAVKKLEGARQGEKQFRAEVSTIGNIQHVNLIKLHGFCSEGTKRLLVYEYMPNRSLDSHLFGNNSELLNWNTRYQIAHGAARGLAYLHEECRDCIIHCDIKPENILLDDAFYPKVADFGLAKLVGREFSRVLTTLRGTRGYLAPEWISGVAITSKADVYSYGMMLFEVISGRRNTDQSKDGMIVFFPTWAAMRITEGDVLSLLDCRLEGDANMEELNRACRVACWCIQDDVDHRPSMGQVVQMLEGVLEVNMPPVPRYLEVLVGNPKNILLSNS